MLANPSSFFLSSFSPSLLNRSLDELDSSSLPNPLEPIPLPSPINRKPNIRPRQRQPKQHKLHEKPRPAPTLLSHNRLRIRTPTLPLLISARLGSGARTRASIALIQILRLNGDDVVVIGEFARFGAETEVCDRRNLEVGDVEAFGPFVFGLVLEFEF